MAARSEALTPKPPSRPKPFYTSRRFRKAIAIRTRAPDAEAGAAAIRGEIDATLGAELAVRHHLHRCVDNFVAGLEQVAAVLREQRHPLGKPVLIGAHHIAHGTGARHLPGKVGSKLRLLFHAGKLLSAELLECIEQLLLQLRQGLDARCFGSKKAASLQ